MKAELPQFKERLHMFLAAAKRYSVPVFLLFIFLIYGFLGWRVASLTQVSPDQAAVSAKLKSAGVPHIDPVALQKIQELQDNSVDVQTLFDEARSNPFQE